MQLGFVHYENGELRSIHSNGDYGVIHVGGVVN